MLPGHWVQLGGKFCRVFLTSFDKKCVKFDKRVNKKWHTYGKILTFAF